MDCIKTARIKNKITQAEFAARVGCTQGFVSAMELGLEKPSPQLAKRIKQEFSIELWELRPDVYDPPE